MRRPSRSRAEASRRQAAPSRLYRQPELPRRPRVPPRGVETPTAPPPRPEGPSHAVYVSPHIRIRRPSSRSSICAITRLIGRLELSSALNPTGVSTPGSSASLASWTRFVRDPPRRVCREDTLLAHPGAPGSDQRAPVIDRTDRLEAMQPQGRERMPGHKSHRPGRDALRRRARSSSHDTWPTPWTGSVTRTVICPTAEPPRSTTKPSSPSSRAGTRPRRSGVGSPRTSAHPSRPPLPWRRAPTAPIRHLSQTIRHLSQTIRHLSRVET